MKKEIESQDGIHRWIIDPLNGTNNFGHGIPHFAISTALEEKKRRACRWGGFKQTYSHS